MTRPREQGRCRFHSRNSARFQAFGVDWCPQVGPRLPTASVLSCSVCARFSQAELHGQADEASYRRRTTGTGSADCDNTELQSGLRTRACSSAPARPGARPAATALARDGKSGHSSGETGALQERSVVGPWVDSCRFTVRGRALLRRGGASSRRLDPSPSSSGDERHGDGGRARQCLSLSGEADWLAAGQLPLELPFIAGAGVRGRKGFAS